MRSKRPSDHSSERQIAPHAAPQARPQRRNFLLALGVGGAGAAIVAARTLTAGSVTPETAQEPSPDSKGYELTDHVRRYYRTAKI